jgi:phenylacetate-CoA ligase
MLAAIAGRLVYPLQERLLKRPTFPYLADLERSQWLSRGDIEALQQDKLTTLLHIARQHCPWHAERLAAANINPADGCSLADLQRLPTMDKADAREHADQLVWNNVPGGSFSYNTGGSSGAPLRFQFGRWRQASDAAGRMRARRWWGVEVGAPEVYLWGAPVELDKTDRIKTLRDRLINQLVLNAFEMSPAHMDDYLTAITRFRPHCLYGYASSIALLAAHALERGRRLTLPDLKVVCTTGEPLYPDQRELIGRVFGAPVANEFGSRDIGFTAHEAPADGSPHGTLLLMSESIILEVLDSNGQPTADGEVGEAVMTGLCSDAQPFIRYRSGDMLRAGKQTDPGGRGLHVLTEVIGRSTDFIVRNDGAIMHALAVIYVLRAVPGVAEFRIIQHSVEHIEVLVIRNKDWTDSALNTIEQGLQARLGPVTVDTRLTDHIPPETSGKHRYVVSHVPLPGDLKVATSDH